MRNTEVVRRVWSIEKARGLSFRSKAWYRHRRHYLREALRRRGSTLEALAERLGISHSTLNYILRGERPSTRIDLAIFHLLFAEYGEENVAVFHVGTEYLDHAA